MATADAGSTAAEEFELVGGRRCLDFVNTVTWDVGGMRNERLPDLGALVRWAERVEILDQRGAACVRRLAAEQPAEGERVHAAALEARRVLRDLFRAVARSETPGPELLDPFQALLTPALARLRLVPTSADCHCGWRMEGEDLESILPSVLWSAATLLTSSEVDRVRECGNERCGWMYLDESRNRMRRWCDMKVCGNQAKARRHYQRKRAREAGAPGH